MVFRSLKYHSGNIMRKCVLGSLLVIMFIAITACGSVQSASQQASSSGSENTSKISSEDGENPEGTVQDETVEETRSIIIDPDEIPNAKQTKDARYQVAFVTTEGLPNETSVEREAFDGVKLYSVNHGLPYKYYMPTTETEVTDEDRYEAMKEAVEHGARVVVCTGSEQVGPLEKAAREFPYVNFVIIIDDYSTDLLNVACLSFREEQSGFFAGYTIVREGFTRLGFCGGGGGIDDKCCRYGYGFVQGANEAAKDMGIEIDMNYSWKYGSDFSASPELKSMASSWYENGTEVIFVCGGEMFDSVTAAASENDDFVIGAGSDQSRDADTVISSAHEKYSTAVEWAIDKVYDDTWYQIGGDATILGAKEGATGVPDRPWMMENYSVEDYKILYDAVASGSISVDNDYSKIGQKWSNLNLNII